MERANQESDEPCASFVSLVPWRAVAVLTLLVACEVMLDRAWRCRGRRCSRRSGC